MKIKQPVYIVLTCSSNVKLFNWKYWIRTCARREYAEGNGAQVKDTG